MASTTDLWLLPLVCEGIGMLSALFFPVRSDAGVRVKARPPAAAFGIVWTVLYALVGISWAYARVDIPQWEANTVYLVLMGLLVLWCVFWSLRQKRWALWELVLSWAYTAFLIQYAGGRAGSSATMASLVASTTLVPLLGWLTLAAFLNYGEVER